MAEGAQGPPSPADADRQVRIGRFAEATRLSVTTLRHYDDIGLLRPARVDPRTGYRFYRMSQARRAESIRVLRAVDMPLEDIAALLDAAGTPQRMAVLEAHRRRLADARDRHERMLTFVTRLLDDPTRLLPYDVTVTWVADRTVASTRLWSDLAGMPARLAEAFGRVHAAVRAAGRDAAGPPLLVLHDIVDEGEPGEVEAALPVDGAVGARDGVSSRALAGGPAAVTTHRGPYTEIAPAYHAVTSWMAAHEHEPAGPPRELYLNDPRTVGPVDLRTRVEWPVLVRDPRP